VIEDKEVDARSKKAAPDRVPVALRSLSGRLRM
jgi:hypothetical protein